jgi:hypothetical protein
MSFIESMINGLLSSAKARSINRHQFDDHYQIGNDYHQSDGRYQIDNGPQTRRVPMYNKQAELWNSLVGPSCPTCR